MNLIQREPAKEEWQRELGCGSYGCENTPTWRWQVGRGGGDVELLCDEHDAEQLQMIASINEAAAKTRKESK